jgi:hypothetical protein
MKGTSGNPNGRPAKVREARALLEANAPALVQKAIDAALDEKSPAHPVALRLVIERLVTISKAMTHLSDRIDAPEVNEARDLPAALLAIVRGVVAGTIPLDTLAPLTGLLVGAQEATEVREVAKRLASLEAYVHERNKLLVTS